MLQVVQLFRRVRLSRKADAPEGIDGSYLPMLGLAIVRSIFALFP